MTGFTEEELRVDHDSAPGWLLREYWHPICLVADVATLGSRHRAIILGMPLIVMRLRSGQLVCLIEYCPHRGASLFYGFIGDHSVTCPYHGWEFNSEGRCLARPFEDDVRIPQKAHTTGFQTVERYGFVFAYFGHGTPPGPPSFDVLERDGMSILCARHSPLKCSWLALQENAADVTHTVFLHSQMSQAIIGNDTTGFGLPLRGFGFQPFEHGIIKTWKYAAADGSELFGYGNILLLPNLLVIETEVHWRVPVDSKNTLIFIASAVPRDVAQGISTSREIDFRDSSGRYDLSSSFGQDAMALETSGARPDDSEEVLGRSDFGVLLFRSMIRVQMEKALIGNEAALAARPADGRYLLRRNMGGYLPSTGLHRGVEANADGTSWVNIVTNEYKEFTVGPGKLRSVSGSAPCSIDP
jgi:5,5'-dehydrodivanillate O-demethylase